MKTATFLRLFLLLAALLATATTSFAADPLVLPAPNAVRGVPNRVQREAIREMPILERPYRFGHFYGNTVRRRHHRQMTGLRSR